MIDPIRGVDLGSIQVHKKAIADIASSAMAEIDGVKLPAPDIFSKAKEIFGYRTIPGIIVTVDKNNQVSVELRVVIRYGINISDIARQIQETVRSAVERTIDISLKDINVNVQGIEKGIEKGGGQ